MSSSSSPGSLAGQTDLAVQRLSVTEIADRLAGLGQDFNNAVYPLLDRIRQLEAPQPWGATDEFGKQFTSSVYNHALSDGTPFSQALRTAMDRAGKDLTDFAERARSAMEQYRQADNLPYTPANTTK